MKQKIKFGIYTSIAVMFLSNNWAFAQFQQITFSTNNSWRTQANPLVNRVGIGNFPNGTNLPSVLTINANFVPNPTGEVFRTTSNAPAGGFNAWRLFTGAGQGTEMFNINNATGSNNVSLGTVQNGSLDIFSTNPLNAFSRRIRVYHDNAPTNEPRVGIGTATTPRTYLQLGSQCTSGGFRSWMNVGTLCAIDNDLMYVGMRHYSPDVNEAIINWGNNPLPQAGVDLLRFVFTASASSFTQASGVEGLEISRMVTDGNIGMMGIGGDPFVPNFYSTGTANPQNTLEVNSTAPALFPVNNPNTSTGFSMNNGHTPIPPIYATPTGFSGLRLTDLTAGSIPELNPSANVLSVDANGDIILVPGGTGTVNAANNGTLTTANAEALLAQSKTIAQLQQKLESLESRLNQLIAQNTKTENN